MMNADDILFRCSSLGHLMVEPKNKSELISETTKTHLVDVYVSNKYNRFTEINSLVLDKGNDVEEDSITIISRRRKEFMKKNEIHLRNAFIKGTPDLFKGEEIYKAEIVRDAKSAWDAYTFYRSKYKPVEKMNYWQLQGYMALTGAKSGSIDRCLTNTPYHIVEGLLRRQSYNHPGMDTPAWIELQVIANHVYDMETFQKYIDQRGVNIRTDSNSQAVFMGFVEIPIEDRHFAFEFERNDTDIERLYDKIKLCRNWMKENLFNT